MPGRQTLSRGPGGSEFSVAIGQMTGTGLGGPFQNGDAELVEERLRQIAIDIRTLASRNRSEIEAGPNKPIELIKSYPVTIFIETEGPGNVGRQLKR